MTDAFPHPRCGKRLRAASCAPADHPSGRAGDVLTVPFTVAGIPRIALNGGPAFAPGGDGTRVTTVFDADMQHSIAVQRDGWQAILDNFASFVGTQAAR